MGNTVKIRYTPPLEVDREHVTLGSVILSVRDAFDQGFLKNYTLDPETGKVQRYTLTEKGQECVLKRGTQ